MRKLSVILLGLLMAVLFFSLVACGSGSSPSAAPIATATSSPSRLTFTTQPGGGIAGLAFATQPVVAVEDAAGNPVTNYHSPIELKISAGTGNSKAQIFGGTRILPTNGPVEFKSLSIDKAGTGYTLTASSGTLTPVVSAPFTISPGKPAKLAFSVQPSDGTAGMPLSVVPEVIVQDKYGNVVTDFAGSVTVSATGYYTDYSNQQPVLREYAAAVSGTTTENLVNGSARFSDVSIQLIVAPKYTLTAHCNSLEPATSAYFSVSAAAPTKLELTVQPSGAKPGQPFESQPIVAIVDNYGNVVNRARSPITVSITPGSGASGAILSGTTTINSEDALGGVSEFTDLAIDKPGSGYTLTATASGLQSAQSQTFNVSAQ